MTQNSTFQTIDCERAQRLIQEQEVTIVDIRDPMSYADNHIDKAMQVNDANLQIFLDSTDKNQPLLVYCYHGHSSIGAAQYFNQAGFTQVYSLDGGFEAWRGQFPA